MSEQWDTKQWLTADRIRTKNPSLAWRYLHEQDCVSALSIIKFSKWLKTEEEYIHEKIEEEKIKQSWGELSFS